MTRTPVLVLVLAIVAAVLSATWMLGPAAEITEDRESPSSSVAPDEELQVEAVELIDIDSAHLDEASHESSEREAVAFAEIDTVVDAAIADAAASAGSLIARGRVVDAATGEPLPGYSLDLRDSERRTARVVTNESGHFASIDTLVAGPLAIRARELARDFDPRLATELRVGEDGSAREIEVRVESGPTYRLAITPPDASPVERMSAVLVASSARDAPRMRGTLGEDDAPWVRFAPTSSDASEGEIVLDSRDGVWRGRAKVRIGRGVQPGVVSIVLESFAALEVRVVGADDQGLARAIVTWTPNTGGRSREQTTRDGGVVVWERAAAESALLTVRLTRYLDFEMPLVLEKGVRRVEIVKLVRAPSAGAIRGTVVSDTGTYEREVDLRLLPLADGRGGVSQVSTKVEWSDVAGAKVGRFEFEDLPIGRWHCQVSEDDWYRWESRRVEVEVPRSDLVFVVHDAVPVADLEFQPRDENGAVFSGAIAVRFLVKGEQRLYRGSDGRVLVESFPVDSPLRWRVDSDGRAAVFGGWGDLSPLASVGGRERRGAAPILESGWAQAFRVVRHDNSRAVAGAKALVDGREAGVTGADGRIVLRAGTRPARVQFRFKDWNMRGNAVLSPTNASAEFENTVRLEVPKNARKKKP